MELNSKRNQQEAFLIEHDYIRGWLPHKIYAFSTNQAPGYLKVGETSRRVWERLHEWQRKIPDLTSENEWNAMLPEGDINSTTYFSDHAIHHFFDVKEFENLPVQEKTGNSNEFYKVTLSDIDESIKDINFDFLNNNGGRSKYEFYEITEAKKRKKIYKRNQDFALRNNQKAVLDNILTAVASGQQNLLMYAVMRFGKTFVSLEAAKHLNAKFVVVVSAKKDVLGEWKENVESHKDFSDYVFMSSKDLLDPNIISKTLDAAESDAKRIVLFLTLQDLTSKGMKEKHVQVFSRVIDLLIIDESHFGARAQSFGDVLRQSTPSEKTQDTREKKGLAVVKELKSKVRLHLSGTPYRILMGSEFSNPKQVVAKVQFADILDEKKSWYEIHPNLPEWENPYFGFPEMVRFAFNLSRDAVEKMNALRANGATEKLNEFFRPLEIDDNQNQNSTFAHETEVLNFLHDIDGSGTNSEIFPFLDFDRVKMGKMARHIVMVLPFRASVDAMEKLIRENKDSFLNLQNYTVINISGFKSGDQKVDDVKARITELDLMGEMTISLTVNRMLTGVTVPEWDTMIFLKDTSSPQEYDQSIYRLQSKHVKNIVDPGGKVVGKEDVKPQTLLIDFSPERMISLEQNKAFFSAVNSGENGNSKIEENLERQLRISPIITLNAGVLTEVAPTDVMAYVANYSANRGVAEEVEDIPVDLSLMNNSLISDVIMRQGELNSSAGIEGQQNEEGDKSGDDGDVTGAPEGGETGHESPSTSENTPSEENDQAAIARRFKSYYSRILFYAFLSPQDENSLSNIITTIDENARLAQNLGIEKVVLKEFQQLMSPYALGMLDNKILNMNSLDADDSIPQNERLMTAIRSFGKISAAEVFTPQYIANKMSKELVSDSFVSEFKQRPKAIIDLASRSGVFLLEVYKMLLESGVDSDLIRGQLFAVVTSPIAYEFTRKTFESMGWPVENIVVPDQFDSIKLATKLKEDALREINGFYGRSAELKFDVVIGNPPYQLVTAKKNTKNGQKTVKNIFQYFQEMADEIADKSVLIYPGRRWIHQSGRGLSDFGREQINSNHLERIIFYPKAQDVFPTVSFADGVSVVVKDKNANRTDFEFEYVANGTVQSRIEKHPGEELLILNPDDLSIVNKIEKFVISNNFKHLYDRKSSRSLFGIESGFIQNANVEVETYDGQKFDPNLKVKVLTNGSSGAGGRAKWFLLDKDQVPSGVDSIDKWKVVVSSAHAGGQDNRDNQLEVLDNSSVFGRSRVAMGLFDTQEEAKNFFNYMKTDLVKYTLLMSAENLSSVGKHVPDLGDYLNEDYDFSSVKKLDEQLKDKIGLTDSESQYIAQVVHEAAPKSKK